MWNCPVNKRLEKITKFHALTKPISHVLQNKKLNSGNSLKKVGKSGVSFCGVTIITSHDILKLV